MPDPDRTTVVVAGHLCLDVIPVLDRDAAAGRLDPGALDLVGPAMLAAGGCVGNTGLALHRLGVPTRLVARVGDDPLGRLLHDLVARELPRERAHLAVTPGQPGSYSVIFSRPGLDRSILHFPGVNDTFAASDLPARLLADAAVLHVGYPPVMAALVAEGGAELARLLAGARAAGVATSLDLAAANVGPAAGIDWPGVLDRVLPQVDVFLPSLAELSHLVGQPEPAGGPDLARVARLAEGLIARGVAIAGVKLGEAGLLIRTASAERLAAVPLRLGASWADRELHSTVFETTAAGTAGAGDATIAGFLLGLGRGFAPEQAVSAACAVGASSVEAPDGTSGIPRWEAVEARLAAGWRRRPAPPAAGWRRSGTAGVSVGPADRSAAG